MLIARQRNVNGGGYGQNIGTGYPATPLGMGQFITEGLYNSEVNNYIYYGGEPDTSTLNQWGHFSQIVWQNTGSVGCYTQDCSTVGLTNAGPPIPPFFTVCNYSPPGKLFCLRALVRRPVIWEFVFYFRRKEHRSLTGRRFQETSWARLPRMCWSPLAWPRFLETMDCLEE